MEDVGEEYFKILTSRSFFQPSRSCFIMHDCVHDLAAFVLGDFGFRKEENNNVHNLPSKTRHLSITRSTKLEQLDGISNAKCLRTFLSLESFLHYPPLKLLMDEGCLRVLSLYGSWITVLPDSIGNLKHLRYLDVSSTPIKEIPDTICTLYNLETLLLVECIEVTRLPNDVGCLIKLRHLDFSGSSIKKLPLHIFNMKNLQTIKPSFVLGKKHADYMIKDLGCFQYLHGEFRIEGLKNLVDAKNVCEAKLRDKKFITELHLNWYVYSDDSDDSTEEREVLDPQELGLYRDGDSEDSMKEREILDRLQPHTNLKKLYIEGYSATRLSDWMGDQSFSSIVHVELRGCENCRSLWPLDQLPSLKTLYIDESFRRVETINWEFFSKSSSMTKPFRSLESLYLGGMIELKEWLFREGEVVFPTLKLLWLSICPNLEVRLLPDCFPSLTRLKVEWCRQVMPFLIPATHQGLMFPPLQELQIRGCREQELILEGGLPSSLERITISSCDNLKALDNNGFRLLTSLRKLDISFCYKLQCLPELPSYPFDLEIRMCPLLNSRCQENGEGWLKIKHARLKLTEFFPVFKHRMVLD